MARLLTDMPTRIIRDGILTSERVNALSERSELFYRRLMSVVDDHGRCSANLTLLRASCYPLKLDSVKEDSIKKHLAEAVDAGLIVLYTVAGKPYLQMVDFGQRVQSKSKFPDPPEIGDSQKSTVIHGESPGKTALDGDGDGDGDEGCGASPALPVPPPAILIPVNDGSEAPISEAEVAEFSKLYPAVEVLAELRKMRGWALANPAKRKTRGGLLRFVTSWLGKEQDKGGSRVNNGGLPQVTAPRRREV